MLKQFCLGCHSGPNANAGINLAKFTDAASVLKAKDVWEKVSRNVDDGHMPPSGAPQPSAAQRDALVSWVESLLSQAQCQLQDPGRVTMRRLNRAEYNNTIRDLVGVDFHPADDFPSDDVGYGFDNIGDVLSISPLLMEKYLNAAEKIAQTAIATPEDAERPVRFPANKFDSTLNKGFSAHGGFMLYTNGSVFVDYDCPKTGEYALKVNAYGDQAGSEPAKMQLQLDNQPVTAFDVSAVEKAPKNYIAQVHIAGGKHRIAMAFTNDYYNENAPKGQQDRNLIVNALDIVGPPGLPDKLPDSHRRIIFVQPNGSNRDEATRKILADFARRAYRRPVTKDDVDRLVACANLAKKENQSFEEGIRLGMIGALVSPNFLFHVELPPNPTNPSDKSLVSNYELASRLSYFLWSSMPDEELMAVASKGKLQDPQVLAAQAKRMLKDPKVRAFADNFAGQWLQLRNLQIVAPDKGRFPDFNNDLRTAMRTETELFFDSIIREDHSVLDFLDAKYTFLNEPLAKHYGISGVTGADFRRVAVDGTQRGGILTQASILTVTSNPTRTSPVKRGKWVLENLLGTPPPPAPPNVPKLADDTKQPLTGTLRQRMEQHRKDPNCASCHARMDPLGFGLENFDAVGSWRTKDGAADVDASGVLPNGQAFNGPAQLKAILMSKKTLFVHCLTEKMLTYALGRGIEPYDKCNVNDMVNSIAKNDYRFSAVVTAIVQSDPFRKRRGDGGTK